MDLAFQMRHLMIGEHFNGLRTMKKIYMIVAALSVVFAAVSCNKEDVTVGSSEPIVVRFTAQAADVKAQFNPTSYENGAAVPVLWDGGENLSIAVGDKDAKDFARNCAEVVASDDKRSATWEYDFSGLVTDTYAPEAPFTFHAFCGSVRAYRNGGASRVLLNNIPSEQTPGENSCDPKAIYLYSKSAEYQEWPSEVEMNPFEHLTAYGCITLGTGIPEDETIQSLTITADASTHLSGGAWYYYATGDEYADYTGADAQTPQPSSSITLKPAEGGALSRENLWFGCRPTTALTSLTFEVVTEADETYKVVKDLTGKNLNFTAGKVAMMTINGFEKVEEEEEKEILTYVWEASSTGSGFILGAFAQGKGEGLTWNNSTASQTFDYGEPSLKWTVETTSSTYSVLDGFKGSTQRLKIADNINPFKFTINTGSSYKVKKVRVYASAANSGCRQITIKVGEEILVPASSLPASMTFSDIEFGGELSEAVQGDVSVDISTIEGKAAKVTYLYKVELTMEKISSQE